MNTLAGCAGEEAEQLVLHVGEVQHATGHGGLVRLEVQHERPVLDDVGPHALAGPPEQVLQARHQLLGPGGQRRRSRRRGRRGATARPPARADGEEERASSAPPQAQVPAEGHGRPSCRRRRRPSPPSTRDAAVGARRRDLVGTRRRCGGPGPRSAARRSPRRAGRREAEQRIHRSVRLRAAGR